MSNPATFINNYITAAQQMVATLEKLRLYNTMLAADPTLTTRYFDVTKNPSPRIDIAAADITSLKDAVVQMLFTFDSGTPAQKAAFFKVEP